MQYFSTVLTDTCEVDNHIYVIHTKIQHFTYRIEVYKNNSLIDTIEETLNEQNLALLNATYTKAHQETRQKYCKKVQENIIPKKTIPTKVKQKKELNQNYILKISIATLLALVALLVFYFTFFRYSALYTDTFYPNLKDKVAYLEEIEPKSNLITRTCFDLSKKNRLEDEVFTIKNCKQWCQAKIIHPDSCSLTLAYIEQNYQTVQKAKPSNTLRKSYVILPKNILELSHTQDTALQINNLRSTPLNIRIKKLVLNDNPNEEIVQFRHTLSNLDLRAHETKKFFLFLEPTYYEQFKKLTYSGHLEFEITQEGNTTTALKNFTFTVN